MRRGLFEVQPEAELACVARARACREGGGTARRGERRAARVAHHPELRIAGK